MLRAVHGEPAEEARRAVRFAGLQGRLIEATSTAVGKSVFFRH
jgi:hypothetical protein